MTRPKPRSAMPSSTAASIAAGALRLPSIAFAQSCSLKPLSLPGEGPPALFTRMSGAGQAASSAARPLALAMSPAAAVTATSYLARISSAVCSSAAGGAGVQHQRHALGRQRLGAGAAQSLAGRADDGRAALQPEIHAFAPLQHRSESLAWFK